MTITEKLRRLGEDANKSRIGRRCGLGATTISNYIARGALPRCDIALKMARAFHVSVDWLIDDQQDWPPVWQNAPEREPSHAA